MSYAAIESSREDGSPIEIVSIIIGDGGAGKEWFLCSGEDEVTIDDVTYIPTPLKRDNFNEGERDAEPHIEIPGTHEFAQMFREVPPSETCVVTVSRLHRTDEDGGISSSFRGIVSAVSWVNNGATAQIGLAPFSSALSKAFPRFVYSGLCNHVLGGRWCEIDLDATDPITTLPYRHSGEVTAYNMATQVITVDGLSTGRPAQYFQAGMIRVGNDQRLVVSQSGDDVKIYAPFHAGTAIIGETAIVTVGCAHDIVTCQNKFANTTRYGGFPYTPLINPFASGLRIEKH